MSLRENTPKASVVGDAAPWLTLSGIGMRFGALDVLDGVDLSLRRGRALALMGANGAGKSTLMNILCGGLTPTAGAIRIDGKIRRFSRPAQAREAGVAIVHQELAQAPDLTVAENISLGATPTDPLGFIDRRAMTHIAEAALTQVGADLSPHMRLGDLGVAQRQLVEIARALSQHSRLLILDEPTSALGDKEASSLIATLGALRDNGLSILYVSHRLDEIQCLSDEIAVLRDGRLQARRDAADVDRAWLIAEMIGRSVSEQPPPRARAAAAAPLLEARDLCRLDLPEGKAKPFSFFVRPGEVLGLGGLVGSGRTELLERLAGVDPGRWTGTLHLGGREYAPRAPAEAVKAGVAFVTEDRKASGLLLEHALSDNIALAALPRVSRNGWIDPRSYRGLAQDAIQRLEIRCRDETQSVGTLSGGNQQKVVLAKWLQIAPRLLLLDEPTRGIDVAAKEAFYLLLDELRASGMAVILASSDWPELLTLSDRVLVMCEGSATAQLPANELDEERLLALVTPGGGYMEPAA